MTDPISLALIGGAASGVAAGVAQSVYETVAKPWVKNYWEKHHPSAIAKAEENTQAFLLELVSRVQRLEAGPADAAQKLDAALKDPDVAAVLQAGVLGAARTNSSERHRIIAESIAQRLKSEAGSSRAVASTLAVESVSRLAGVHLEVLGLLALLYHIRGPVAVVDESDVTRENWKQRVDAARPIAAQYGTWLDAQFALYDGMEQPSADTLSHLVSASCITHERKVRRDLLKTIRPEIDEDDLHASPYWRALDSELYRRAGATKVGQLWHDGLQHARPTPAGLLLGCVVHDIKAGTDAAAAWEWSDDAPMADATKADVSVWDGRRDIDYRFLDQLERELTDRLERHFRRK